MMWQPIKTAPKDGTEVLVYAGGFFVAYWNGRSWDDGDFYDHIDDVTHWMPLPDPPIGA